MKTAPSMVSIEEHVKVLREEKARAKSSMGKCRGKYKDLEKAKTM